MLANLDLCDLENVKSFKGRLEKIIGDKKVDVLMNNAGVMAIPDKILTKDGFEKVIIVIELFSICHFLIIFVKLYQTFQTNHLGEHKYCLMCLFIEILCTCLEYE